MEGLLKNLPIVKVKQKETLSDPIATAVLLDGDIAPSFFKGYYVNSFVHSVHSQYA